MTDRLSDWEAKRAFMRGAGAISAAWHPDGSLQALTLGPEQPPSRDQNAPKPEQHKAPTMRQLLHGSTSRLVPRATEK
jgi:hypothetical protein